MTPNHGASGLSPERNTNGDGNNSKQTGDTFVPLFPEIQAHSPPKPVQITRPRYAPVAPRPIQPIMPKTGAWSCAKIAPRPSSYVEPVKRCLEDNQDDIALKRQKNTDAARRSRLKKVKKMEALEERVSELEGEKSGLVTRIAVLESEKAGLEAKDRGLEERIRVLEKQLAEAHKALTKQ
ncbi:uncharacterized protein BYT42DRAFT_506127 [Radiomyces spectabilis]|uniref:uncharacterized protein n=1 Tax=Radiomyces spectabilis TaxID=64574 RepID=UPI00221E8E89|nr:uncharacterized protein BYT42DRAFT_506127 [Radiomyces spectabilis]KAI8364736.1 hypothetical protein BYT42DRAFT_506127 [Radiomyces spectabilis]